MTTHEHHGGLDTGRARLALLVAGGVALSGVAGFVNVVLLTEDRIGVTHVTGTVSRLSADLPRGDAWDALSVLPIIGAFMLGAVVSGAAVGEPGLRLGRTYGVVMLLEAALLAVAAALSATHVGVAAALAAGAAGMQNGMASSYGSLIVRTTHVTGVVTDLGFLVGSYLRTRRVQSWKFLLLSGLLGGFVAGGVLGAWATMRWDGAALYAPAAAMMVMGATYFTIRRARSHRN